MRILYWWTLTALFLLFIPLTQCNKPQPPSSTKANQSGPIQQDWEYGAAAYQHTAAIVEFGPRPTESDSLKQVRTYVSNELAKHNWITLEQTFTADTPIGSRTFTNTIARYQPSGSPQSSVWKRSPKGVLGAHIESKLMPGQNFVGADDAASAVGAIIEIAAHLHKHDPTTAKALELTFFDGEEAFGDTFDLRTALFGSRHYATLVQRSYPKTPSFGIILDMIGHKDLSITLPSNSPEHLVEQTFELVKQLGVESQYKRGGPVLDDHVPLNIIANIPTIDLLGDFSNKSWWHTPEDNLEIISSESLAQNIKLTLLLIAKQLK